ncbi:hypothetical protein PV325_003919 [Microctonus aethiopoides]|nr:hypothetical protein PV325_003919 [Microctonus aethiopoides]
MSRWKSGGEWRREGLLEKKFPGSVVWYRSRGSTTQQHTKVHHEWDRDSTSRPMKWELKGERAGERELGESTMAGERVSEQSN